jgi:DMSO/TMAO reductase YedYZ molybdopterin-dependent catalytic subunit
MAVAAPAWAAPSVELPLPGGPDERSLTAAFPEKGSMILQRTRPHLLETPFEVFDRGVFTPNDKFYVRWHWAVIPEQVDVTTFRLIVHGHVNQILSLSLSLAELRFNGAMGDAKWTGVRLRDVLDRAGVKAGAVAVRFKGADQPVVDGAPHFMKSLALDHARDGEVTLAYQMNGEQLPLLNGFPSSI